MLDNRDGVEVAQIQTPFTGVSVEMVVGAVSGTVTDGLLGAFVGGVAAPLLARALPLAQQELHNRSVRRQLTLSRAFAETGDPDTALAAAATDPDLVYLLYAAGDAAEHTRSLKKLVLLSDAVANGLVTEDRATIDYAILLVEAMDKVERPHLALLTQMIKVESEGPMTMLQKKPLDWDQLREASRPNRPALAKIIADLETGGLLISEKRTINGFSAGDVDVRGNPLEVQYWEPTDFGLDLLAKFREIGLRYGRADDALSY
ncbi:MAG: hypothetical protein WAL50_15850 [Kineosporiaceae bacterium]